MAASGARGEPIDYNNAALRRYYHDQHICDDPRVEEAMWARYREELPITFRLTCTAAMRRATERYYAEEAAIPQLAEAAAPEAAAPEAAAPGAGPGAAPEAAPEAADRPRPVAQIPEAFILRYVTRRGARKVEAYKAFRDRLVGDFERGAVQRQELVSMVPPVLLQPAIGDSVLDMCAAPGSKTSQILDMMHRQMLVGEGRFELARDAAVLANDITIERARLLSHQLGKVASPLAAIICGDASAFPKSSEERTLFSRVLCDVPCTGDGTTRKNYEIWQKWSVQQALDLHERQLQILVRGIENLAPGGRLVYSTCSMNPIENEAVVAAALSRFPEELILRDAFEAIPGLPARAGLSTWLVPNSYAWLRYANREKLARIVSCDGEEPSEGGPKRRRKRRQQQQPAADVDKAVDALLAEVEGLDLFCDSLETAHAKSRVKASMFPGQHSAEVLASLNRAARFIPEPEFDSGGFFAAIIERKKESLAPLKKTRPPAPAEPRKRRYDDSVRLVKVPAATASSLLRFYGLSARVEPGLSGEAGLVPESQRWPIHKDAALSPAAASPALGDLCDAESGACDWFYQNEGDDRRISLATPRLAELYEQSKGLEFISCGAKVFERVEKRLAGVAGCDYRLTSDGAVWLRQYMRRRVVMLSAAAARELLEADHLDRRRLLELESRGEVAGLDSCRSGAAKLLECGGCVVSAESAQGGALSVAALVTAHGTLQALVKKTLRPALLALIPSQ